MATFLELYGERLSRELGSADTSNLFTTARRKAAINEGQTWFVTQTECLTRTAAIALVDGTREYDVEDEISDADFFQLARQGAEVAADPGGGGEIIYYAGKDFQRTSIPELNREHSGWRTLTGTPEAWYERDEGGAKWFGLHPEPAIPVGATWTLSLPYVVLPAAMSANGDLPFTVDSDSKVALTPWHDALVYYAASELEKLRKGTERSVFLRQQAEQRVLDYLNLQRPVGGKRVQFGHHYYDAVRVGTSQWGRHDDPRK